MKKRSLSLEEIGECRRLKAIWDAKRKEMGLTQQDMADTFGDGVTQGAVSHYLNGKNALNLEAALVFSKRLGVPLLEFSPRLHAEISHVDSFATGSAAATKRAHGNVRRAESEQVPDGYVRLRQVDVKAAAGEGMEVPAHIETVRWLDVARDWAETEFRKQLPDIRICTARGDSMTGLGIMDGDLLFVNVGVRTFQGDGNYVLSFRGGLQVKRIQVNHLAQRLEIVSHPPGGRIIQPVEPEQEDRLHISGRVSAWWTLRR